MPDDELLRVRDRLHKVEGSQHALHERQRIGDRERRQLAHRLDEFDRRLQGVEHDVGNLVNEDRIAEAVAARMAGNAADGFTRLQAWGIRAAIVGAITSPIIVGLQAAGVI